MGEKQRLESEEDKCETMRMTRVTSVKNCQGHESSSVQDFACVSRLFVASAREILFFAFKSLQN
jgi:hypothetical protein